MPRQGPLLRISSALKSELNASARTVVAVALGPNRGDRLGVSETSGVSNGSILAAFQLLVAVAVMYELGEVPAGPAASPNPHLQRVEGKIGVQAGR
jgi:hypothetical protein